MKNENNRIFFKKFITSILFVIVLFAFSIENLIVSYKPLKESIEKQISSSASLKNAISSVEYTMQDSVYKKYSFIDTYGYIQRLLGKNEESNFEVVKDTNGILHYTYFGDQANPVYSITKRTVAFKNGLKNKKTKFGYIMPPDKYINGYSQFPTGIPYNYVNETTDKFLQLLNQNKIDTIDLRKNLDKSGIAPDKLFFRTDHHWQTQTVFWEFGQLLKDFKTKYGMDLDPTGFYTDKNNYNFVTYKNSYIGSLGRKSGIPYTGVDDFTLIYPKFKTSFTYTCKTGNQAFSMSGRFEDTLINMAPFTERKGTYELEEDKYSSYLIGNQGIAHIVNKDKPNGPKILLVKDSLSVPLAAFLSTVCSDVYLVDPRYYSGDIPTYVNSIKDLDYVFITYSPQDLTNEFFNFYENK